MKPTIIYVSGAPGSGKTTLARLLSDQLYMPHISSDLVHGGIEFTQSGHDRNTAIGAVFLPTLIDMTKRGISVVVDHVLRKDIAKTTIIEKLEPYATIVYIHTQAKDPIGRYMHRTQTSDLPDIVRRRKLLLERAEHHTQNLINTRDPIELGIPTLVVNTDDGYAHGLDKIVSFITDHKAGNSVQ